RCRGGAAMCKTDFYRAAGYPPLDGEDYVNGISGGTITSKGVGSMLDNCLTPYKKFLQTLGEGKQE
ncbi:MAG: FMN-binding protein, partial [Duncaniella sp.]|nr:FMN-binding protein [Duncaniella sp.]